MLPEMRHIMDGVDRAHSFVVNAHKWMLTPIDLSAFYTPRPDILRRAFSLVPEYLRPQQDPRAHNLMDYGVPLGHRFRALKLWFVLRYFGRERMAGISLQNFADEPSRAPTIHQDVVIGPDQAMTIVVHAQQTDTLQRRPCKIEFGAALSGQRRR